uniref:Neurotransmitter-gated ion-channel ligand-binding domain-containing protein n=1 Tax=Panagrolaimus davidi TaxID=227884 RepID=A0A914PMI1_9BILA
MRYHEFLFLIFFCCKNFFIHASPEESDLYLDLLKEYYPYERPVEHSRDNVTVYVGLILQQIVDVTWFDYRLRWDPSNYAGITEVRFRRNQIWTPGAFLFKNIF